MLLKYSIQLISSFYILASCILTLVWMWHSDDWQSRKSAAESYPSSDRLQDAGQGVVLQLEKVRGLTVHLETIGVVVEFHRTHKVADASHHIGELRGERTSVTPQSHHHWPLALIVRSPSVSALCDTHDCIKNITTLLICKLLHLVCYYVSHSVPTLMTSGMYYSSDIILLLYLDVAHLN